MGSLRRQFGMRLQQLRKAAGLTQEALARRCGMDYKYIGGVERGERNITIDNVERIIQGLAVEPYEPFLVDLRSGKVVENDERVLGNVLRHTDPKVRPLLLELAQAVLRWTQSARKR